MSIEQRGLEALESVSAMRHPGLGVRAPLADARSCARTRRPQRGRQVHPPARAVGSRGANSGHLVLDGHPIAFGSPREAIEHGVSCVYQELSLVDDLTVAQNLFLGREMRQGMRLRLTEMERQTSEFLADFGLAIPATAKVRQLSVAQRQLLEVIIALHRDVRYLLLDEPTTSLEVSQIEYLLQTVRRVAREHDVAVLLVDHRLDEVYAVANNVTALQDGRVVLSVPRLWSVVTMSSESSRAWKLGAGALQAREVLAPSAARARLHQSPHPMTSSSSPATSGRIIWPVCRWSRAPGGCSVSTGLSARGTKSTACHIRS